MEDQNTTAASQPMASALCLSLARWPLNVRDAAKRNPVPWDQRENGTPKGERVRPGSWKMSAEPAARAHSR